MGAITLTAELQPRGPAAALDADSAARAAYEGLAFTHRKEYARWIQEAKRDGTQPSATRPGIGA